MRLLEGRVLGHGENEAGKDFGRHYMLLEGIDARIHLIYYTPEMEEARSRGQLGANSFIQLCKRFENGRPMLQLNNLGDADELLKNKRHFRRQYTSHSATDPSAAADPWGGWLGRYFAQQASAPKPTHGHQTEHRSSPRLRNITDKTRPNYLLRGVEFFANRSSTARSVFCDDTNTMPRLVMVTLEFAAS